MMLAERMSSIVLLLGLLGTTVLSEVAQALDEPCVPSSDKPDIDSLQVKNVASVPDEVLANMVGYVELLGDNTTYLPLDLRYVSVSESDSHGSRIITLEGECVSFELKNTVGSGNSISDHYHYIDGLEMIIRNDVKQDETAEKICDFDQRPAFTLHDSSRYSCTKVITHQCSMAKRRVANLVLRSFELEFSGTSRFLWWRQFSKEVMQDSCDHWYK